MFLVKSNFSKVGAFVDAMLWLKERAGTFSNRERNPLIDKLSEEIISKLCWVCEWRKRVPLVEALDFRAVDQLEFSL